MVSHPLLIDDLSEPTGSFEFQLGKRINKEDENITV